MAGATGHGVPHSLVTFLRPFRDAFTAPTGEHVLVLVTGIILVPVGGRSPRRCGSWVSAKPPLHQLPPRAEPQRLVCP